MRQIIRKRYGKKLKAEVALEAMKLGVGPPPGLIIVKRAAPDGIAAKQNFKVYLSKMLRSLKSRPLSLGLRRI